MSEKKETLQGTLEQLYIAELDSSNAKALADRASIFQDLAFCLECCDRLVAEMQKTDPPRESVLQHALWTAALIAYARCFATGVRQGLTPAIYDKFEGEPREAHQMYLDTRNKHIAHSVSPFERVTIGAVLSPPGAEHREVQGVSTLSMKRISDDINGVQQLRLMARTALGEMERLCKEQQDRVLEEAKLIPIEDLYARATPRLVAPGGKDAGRRR